MLFPEGDAAHVNASVPASTTIPEENATVTPTTPGENATTIIPPTIQNDNATAISPIIAGENATGLRGEIATAKNGTQSISGENATTFLDKNATDASATNSEIAKAMGGEDYASEEEPPTEETRQSTSTTVAAFPLLRGRRKGGKGKRVVSKNPRETALPGNNTNTTLASEIPDAQNVTANRTTSLSANDSTAVSANGTQTSSLGRYVFGSEISYNKAPPRLPGLGC